MADRPSSLIDSFHASLDKLALVPLAFVAVLGFFVIATALVEDTGSAAAARIERSFG